MIDESNNSHKLKLKKIRLKEILNKNKFIGESNNIKTERTIMTSRNKLYSLNNKIQYLNTLNTTCLHKNNKTILNLKYKTPLRNSNLPEINKTVFTKKEIKGRKKIFIDLNEGYVSYLKERKNKIYRRMKHLLFDQKIKKLSLPKYRHIITFENKKTSNSINTKHNYSNKKDDCYQLNSNYKYRKHLNDKQLLEKEKIKERKKFNEILLFNYKKLDSCETKFNSAINKTMKLLSEFQHSLGNFKNEKII